MYNETKQTEALNQRIKMLRKSQHLSQVEMAKILGISQSVISLIESGNTSVSIDLLKSLSEYFNVSCDWLIYGRNKYIRLSPDNHFIPSVDKGAESGYIQNYQNQEFIETLDLYRIPGMGDGEYRVFEAEDESMTPTIQPHDKTVCVKKESIDSIAEGTLTVVVTDSDITVKRINFKEVDRKTIVLGSDNPNFKSREIKASKIQEIWEVKAKFTNKFLAESYDHRVRLDSLEDELKMIKSELLKMGAKFIENSASGTN